MYINIKIFTCLKYYPPENDTKLPVLPLKDLSTSSAIPSRLAYFKYHPPENIIRDYPNRPLYYCEPASKILKSSYTISTGITILFFDFPVLLSSLLSIDYIVPTPKIFAKSSADNKIRIIHMNCKDILLGEDNRNLYYQYQHGIYVLSNSSMLNMKIKYSIALRNIITSLLTQYTAKNQRNRVVTMDTQIYVVDILRIDYSTNPAIGECKMIRICKQNKLSRFELTLYEQSVNLAGTNYCFRFGEEASHKIYINYELLRLASKYEIDTKTIIINSVATLLIIAMNTTQGSLTLIAIRKSHVLPSNHISIVTSKQSNLPSLIETTILTTEMPIETNHEIGEDVMKEYNEKDEIPRSEKYHHQPFANQTHTVLALSLSCQHKLGSTSYQFKEDKAILLSVTNSLLYYYLTPKKVNSYAMKIIAGEYSKYCPKVEYATIVLDNPNTMRKLCNDEANQKNDINAQTLSLGEDARNKAPTRDKSHDKNKSTNQLILN